MGSFLQRAIYSGFGLLVPLAICLRDPEQILETNVPHQLQQQGHHNWNNSRCILPLGRTGLDMVADVAAVPGNWTRMDSVMSVLHEQRVRWREECAVLAA